MNEFLDEDVLVWIEDNTGEVQIAIRRDFGWPSGQWSVAYHKFRRFDDEKASDLLRNNGAKWYRPGINAELVEVTP